MAGGGRQFAIVVERCIVQPTVFAVLAMASVAGPVEVPFEDDAMCCMNVDIPEEPQEAADILKKTFDDDELQNLLEQEVGLFDITIDDLQENGLSSTQVRSCVTRDAFAASDPLFAHRLTSRLTSTDTTRFQTRKFIPLSSEPRASIVVVLPLPYVSHFQVPRLLRRPYLVYDLERHHHHSRPWELVCALGVFVDRALINILLLQVRFWGAAYTTVDQW